MSIERSSTPPSPKSVAGAEGPNGKAKVKSNEENGASDGSGFSAILTSFDAPAEASKADDTPPPPVDDKSQAVAQPVPDPVTQQASNFPADLALLLGQANKAAGSQLSSVGDGAKDDSRLAALGKGADKSAVLMTALSLSGVEKQDGIKQSTFGLLDQVTQSAPGLAHKSKSFDLQVGGAANSVESRSNKLSTFMDISTKESALSSALATSGMGESIVHPVEKEMAKSLELTSSFGGDGSLGQNTVSVGSSRLDAQPFVVTPSMPSPETAVADTVNYWVTQGVQNAQLKLDGFGGESVAVSISLKGDEAHIDFRSDQPEIRQMLEGAVSHLSDLLVSEGLVLSGVSIGASGQDGAEGQDQRSRPDARQATIVSKDVTPIMGRRQVNSSVGRALDLFV